ncbi:sigma 54-interacting transcriptional regulator [Clostridium sp. P21]|uniref:Sigma 54-interacting transcriptional regulator n=1 Tax=Clostridium muellerianum TaxID=2716538 RepID=A0A7Y0HQJ3_9CLOT|nr:sigma 54-interacting transcriptional regulator [Clostridium muellerianum]NMM65190.1 sigma 54-interacting transcriptional regulator [Clostridium muellerianum]
MESKIIKIISSEDKKNPYTDEEIAKQLGILRKVVTEYRNENGIPDSRQRRKELILKDAVEIIKKDRNISDRNFTKELNEKGYNLARYAASNIKKEAILILGESYNLSEDAAITSYGEKQNVNLKSKAEIVNNNTMIHKENRAQVIKKHIDYREDANKKETFDPFKSVIGCEGSLRLQVNQAKAAILYPPKGLHTLLLGPSGVGKSHMAEVMYKFAVTTKNFSDNSIFMVFNCADYADNPQLLLSQLFGHSKGAFTGANDNKKGIVELCNGGILFLDEVHRLPVEGQEILFYLLDKGKFRRLGETETTRESKLMIIAATTENPESSLLLTFRRRIPMIIQIPSVNDRSHDERFQIIKNFFLNESIRLGKDVFVRRDVIKAFMTYDCPGNIGQLKSDIQVCCARGFLYSTLNNKEDVKVNFEHVPDNVKERVLNSSLKDEELETYTMEDIIVSSNGVKVLHRDEYSSVGDNNIYQFIENKYKELKADGYSDIDINKLVGQQVENELMRVASFANFCAQNTQEVINIIGEEILKITEDVFEIAKKHINKLQRKVVYPLAIHLSSTYERILNRREVANPNLQMIKDEYEKEYAIATKTSQIINNRLKINLSEDEIGFIAMYLKHFQGEEEQDEGRVGVIVLSHGRVACGMAEVANRLLGVKHAVGLEMDLSDSPNIMLEKTMKLVEKVNQGKGCILLVDMGSLTTFGDIITAKTGIPTRVIGRVDTLMVLECVRRALLPEDTLDRIADEIDNKNYIHRGVNVETKDINKVIITLCITGEGAATKVKEYIEGTMADSIKGIDIIPLGYMNDDDITSTIDRISKNKRIVAIVGTINPEFKEIPFISVEELITGKSTGKLRKLINNKKVYKNNLSEVIPPEFIFPQESYKYKDEVLDEMAGKLIKAGCVEEGYLLSVYKRETLGGTYLKGGIAIPHGDSRFVTKPTIAVTKLATPINWDGINNIDLIFMIALKEDSKDYFEQLYRVISSTDMLQKIRKAKDREEIMDILFKNTISAK